MTGTAASGWRFTHESGVFRLEHNGDPALFVGGQVHNSSSSSAAAIGRSFAHAAAMGANTVLAPVSWGQVEPEEGRFDFALVDAMLDAAREHRLRLVPLWFGAFKNAASTYAPRWVRADRERFPRVRIEAKGLQAFTYEGAMPKPVLSVFGEELLDADERSFARFILHLRDADTQDTVAMVQVENEVGLLSDSRDRSEVAERAWREPVPDELLRYLAGEESRGATARAVWESRGAKTTGSWADVFGGDWQGDEAFMAWGFARYAERLAAAGRSVKDIPHYANVWLGPQPGQSEAGQYPSGGPGSRVLDIWRLAAPSLELIGPDIYVADAEVPMRQYATGSQPLFVPECRMSAPELVRAIGVYGAVGWSAFGIDDGNPDGPIAQALRFIGALETDISEAGARGELRGIVLDEGVDEGSVSLAGLSVVARDSRLLLKRMLLDAGVRIPETPLVLPDETHEGAMMPTPADPRPFALLFRSGDTVTAMGRGVSIDVAEEGRTVEIDRADELLLQGRECAPGRELNGDERLRLLPDDRVGAVRIRLLRN